MTDGGTPLGGSHARPDALAKVTGQTRYVGDIALPGMLHAAVAAADVSSARVGSVDTSRALEIPGVEAVMTAQDVPGANLIGVIFPDQPLLVEDRVRMVGDRFAVVAARSPEAAWRSATAVSAQLEPLAGVHDPVEALKAGADAVHDSGNLVHTFRVERGDIKKAEARATVVVEAEYRIGGQEHAYLEPQACLAIPEAGRVTVLASCQCPFYIQQGVARVLGLPLSAVRVEQAPTGGAFGGKEDYPSEPAACAALLAWRTRRPVRLLYPREHDLQATTKRHAMRVHHRWGADRAGRLRFAEVDVLLDAGAYAGLSTVVAERANASAIGPYDVAAVRVRTRVAYTNNLFGGAFRGFGAPQVTWAHEATMDRLARELGLHPVELRRRNVLGERRRVTSTGQRLPAPVMAKACLEKAVAASSAEQPARALPPGRWLHGTGTALVLYGCNLHHGGQHLDRSSAVVILQADGSAVVRVGLTEMGQGNLVAAQTVAATALGIDPVKVEVWQPDTTTVADSGPTVASRGAHASGLAILEAVRRLRRRLDPVAAELLGCEPSQVMLGGDAARVFGEPEQTIAMEQVVQEMVRRRIETIATGWYRSRRRRFDPATGLGSPYEFYAMACHVARVAVDPDLGLVRVEHVAAAHDVGKVLHRDALEGQIQGGIVQAMGWALTEELKLSRGRLLNPGFTDYLIPTSDDAPAISIALLEDAPGSGPFGSKGIGEPSFIPTAAAIRNAVCDAIGAEVDRLPLTPPVIVEALATRHPFSFLLP